MKLTELEEALFSLASIPASGPLAPVDREFRKSTVRITCLCSTIPERDWRETDLWNWFTQLRRLTSSMICSQQTVDPEESTCSSSPSLKAWESEEPTLYVSVPKPVIQDPRRPNVSVQIWRQENTDVTAQQSRKRNSLPPHGRVSIFVLFRLFNWLNEAHSRYEGRSWLHLFRFKLISPINTLAELPRIMLTKYLDTMAHSSW